MMATRLSSQMQTSVRTATRPCAFPAVQAFRSTLPSVARPTRRQVSRCTCSAAGTPPGPSASTDSHAGHAVLHDFCMTLPFGTISLLTGVISYFLGQPLTHLAIPVAGMGASILVFSSISLNTWRQGRSSAFFTLLSAGASAAVAYFALPYVQSSWQGYIAGALVALSSASALFCLYNILAGGNPPKTGKH